MQRADRILRSLLARAWTEWKDALIFVKPDTVIRWQRKVTTQRWRVGETWHLGYTLLVPHPFRAVTTSEKRPAMCKSALSYIKIRFPGSTRTFSRHQIPFINGADFGRMDFQEGQAIMKEVCRRLAWVFVAAVLSVFLTPSRIAGAEEAPRSLVTAKSIAIVTGTSSTAPETRAAEIFEKRLRKRSAVTVEVVSEGSAIPNTDVLFVVGTTDSNALSKKLIDALGAVLPTLPNSETLHPEGYAIKSGVLNGKTCVVIAGTDGRGTLYGVGAMLRAMTYLADAVVVPEVDMTEKPAFQLRGGIPSGPGSRSREFGDLRPQTDDERQETLEDLMLLGTNTFWGDPKQIRDTYGMNTVFGWTANQLTPGFPREWGADGGRSSKYACPSVPEAHEALLGMFETMFRDGPDYDYFTTNSGDVGGCRCDRCMPWGGTYIKLVDEIAALLHKYHPNTKVPDVACPRISILDSFSHGKTAGCGKPDSRD